MDQLERVSTHYIWSIIFIKMNNDDTDDKILDDKKQCISSIVIKNIYNPKRSQKRRHFFYFFLLKTPQKKLRTINLQNHHFITIDYVRNHQLMLKISVNKKHSVNTKLLKNRVITFKYHFILITKEKR